MAQSGKHTNRGPCRAVCTRLVASSASAYPLPLSVRERRDAALAAPPVPGVTGEKAASGGFYPLKVLLENISSTCAHHDVRMRPSARSFVPLIPLQESPGVGNKITLLLAHIASMDSLFATPPGDVVEQRRRDEAIRHVKSPSPCVRPDPLPASSGTSSDSCDPRPPTPSRRVEICSTCSKVCKNRSSTTRRVRNAPSFPRSQREQQMARRTMIDDQRLKSIVSASVLGPGQAA